MDLMASIEEVKGIGPKKAATLKKAGIRTLRDFFYTLPRNYEGFQAATSIAEMRPGKVVVRGKITDLHTHQAKRRNLTLTEGTVHDDTGSVRVVWFNQGYRVKQFSPDKEYYFTGSYELKSGRYQITTPSATLATDVNPNSSELSPVYVAHGDIHSQDYLKLIAGSRDKFNEIPDLIPSVPAGARKNALFKVHFPENEKEIAEGRQYLAYEELFELILASKLNRRENEKLRAVPEPYQKAEIEKFIKSLPFTLTGAQQKAAEEIFDDMTHDTPMNRLLQGDVGSGKTMVAALAAYDVILNGGQVAILAPTAILATQHYENIGQMLEKFGVRTVLLTGATSNKPRLKRQIASGEVNLIVGTHALLTDDVDFHNLALAVIDEQHRFGVGQRQKLVLKSPEGLAPHFLAMTATPIPRSLQLTVFGDLDVSILNELPKGRKPIDTKVLRGIDAAEELYPKIREVIKAGQQVYWVAKAIEDKNASEDDEEKGEVISVKARTRKLKEVFPELSIEMLHGKMKPAEKDAIMERFASGEIELLVSTTVIEVGVDVPNASLMVIENAEGYGLAQLHQLRGRVGRGGTESYCYLLTSGDAKPTKRLMEVEKSSDGFYLAEVDLKLRGPGEIYGSLQHGALDLRIASLSDTALIHRAQKDVTEFLQNSDNMLKYEELMRNISKYQQLTTLN